MGNKVDISEVIEFSNDLKTTSSKIKSSLDQLVANIDKIDAMESFSGKAAKNSKGYFENFHKEGVIDAFNELFTDLNDNLKQHLESFQSNVDSSESAIIQSDYLNDLDIQIDIDYQKLNGINENIQKAINNVSDITSASAPPFYSITNDENEVIETIAELDGNLSSFTGEGKHHDSQTKALMERIEKTMNSVKGSGEERFSDYKVNKDLQNLKDFVTIYLAPGVTGTTSSTAIAKAAKNKGLSVSKYVKNGKTTYRINASEEALEALGVKPDVHAQNALNQSAKSGQAKAPLNYYDKKTGKQVWSNVGKEVVKSHPNMEVYNYDESPTGKFKSVGRATARGAINSVTDLNPKEIVSGSVINRAGKALGPVGAGLNYYSNYNDAKSDGLTGSEAHTRAAVDTTIDTVVGGAVQTGVTAAVSLAIPIPVVGTAIGVAAGIGVNSLLNVKFGKSNKSVMDRAKDAFHKLTGWFS
ncbi:T7SS effector LXG polymorphic toxin [Lentibacillus sp. Marseille-P4043]|uniref:T7SS effector LXG polymorphic toxin n=1 Tax=Lentibacillus sp. Marseille-P4043 TaxID=2040293 RepID=UPI000D0BDB70|nr:T7SS effector LXG polymorphic toxin [Lentibacillus sp. Marseille-P4043]